MTDKTHRSAITGQYVTAEHAAENLDTTVSERRTRRPAGDYSDLRARAEACPPEDDADSWYSEDRLEFAVGTQDRPFVAACSPIVVLGLLDELDRLRAVSERVQVAVVAGERLQADRPIVRTVGDLTARHIGKRVRVETDRTLPDRVRLLREIATASNEAVRLTLEVIDHPEWFLMAHFDLDTPCEVLA